MKDPSTRISEAALRSHFGVPDDVPSSPAFRDCLARCDTRHRPPTVAELEEYLLMVLRRMTYRGAKRTPEENLQAFEAGWRENLDALAKLGPCDQALRPRYFRDTKFLRYQKSLIVSPNLQLEYDLLVLARHLVFNQYLAGADHIFELGCGSCSNLLQLARMFPDKQLHGLDWTQASVDICTALREQHGLRVDGRRLDMLNPPADLELPPNSAVLTVHAMEQLGSAHGAFTQTLIRSRPSIVVQLEPIIELYDPDNVYDQLALVYSRERNYLQGYLTALRELAASNAIDLITERRPGVGGVIHEASLVVWRPR